MTDSTTTRRPTGGTEDLATDDLATDDPEQLVSPLAELAALIGAAAVGAIIAVTVIGASLLLALPAVVVVAGVALVTMRRDAG